MKKRLLATLLALVMLLGVVNAACAEYEQLVIDSDLAADMSFMATPAAAMEDDALPYVAATLFLELILYQNSNDMEMEAGALWNDCVVARFEDIVAVFYDMDDDALLLTYSCGSRKLVASWAGQGGSLAEMKQAMQNSGALEMAEVDGDEWSQIVIDVLKAIVEGD